MLAAITNLTHSLANSPKAGRSLCPPPPSFPHLSVVPASPLAPSPARARLLSRYWQRQPALSETLTGSFHLSLALEQEQEPERQQQDQKLSPAGSASVSPAVEQQVNSPALCRLWWTAVALCRSFENTNLNSGGVRTFLTTLYRRKSVGSRVFTCVCYRDVCICRVTDVGVWPIWPASDGHWPATFGARSRQQFGDGCGLILVPVAASVRWCQCMSSWRGRRLWRVVGEGYQSRHHPPWG